MKSVNLLISFALISLIKTVTSTLPDINSLLEDVRSKQWKKDETFWPRKAYPPLKWDHQGGLYESNVHLNFHGTKTQSFARNAYKFPDSNGFVTMFIADAIIEVAELGFIDMSKKHHGLEKELLSAVEAILTHRDFNTEANDTPIFAFWNQLITDEGIAASDAPNIRIPIGELGIGLQGIADFLEKIHLHEQAEKISRFAKIPDLVKDVFHIPSDFDDTGCALALGARILKNKNIIPTVSSIWTSTINRSIEAVLETAVKYAYQPFASEENIDSSLIDPRTYFWMRDFLHEFKDEAGAAGEEPSLFLVTTWLQNLDEAREFHSKGIKVPFNVNNVDASVAANFIHGVVAQVIANPEVNMKLITDNHTVELLLQSTSRLLAWTITSEALFKRPDLVLLYYPPIYDFYWFVARIISLLDSTIAAGNMELPSVLLEMSTTLSKAMRSSGTEQITRLGLGVFDKSNTKNDDVHEMYWCDFLGAVDDVQEDCVFSTSVALNALIDTWTIDNTSTSSSKSSFRTTTTTSNTRALQWIDDTPMDVKAIVKQGFAFLKNHSSELPHENAFFSASRKSDGSEPFYYPTNHFKTLDDEEVSCSDGELGFNSVDFLPAVQGLMDPSEYEEKLRGECFGTGVTIDNPTYNCPSCSFPYWSSPALTSALEMLAFAKFNSVQQDSTSLTESLAVIE